MTPRFFGTKALATALAFTTFTGLPTAKAEAGTEPYIGEVMLVGFNFCPRGWIEAAGQRMDIEQNQTLFALYGTIYGGNGTTYFNLPDLRGRVPVSAGQGPGLSDCKIGDTVGTETRRLSQGTLPARDAPADVPADVTARGDTVEAPGSRRPVSNLQPTLVMRYCVAIWGTFPPRN